MRMLPHNQALFDDALRASTCIAFPPALHFGGQVGGRVVGQARLYDTVGQARQYDTVWQANDRQADG